ncbi:hypothetical protein [Thiohalomonas denitrificans]|uniref:hypothetical protein n=1 Tax=Thiohalomonas denitrificans TaxID=415747 RepID=UPI0026EE5A07|nr:hypothetical protein [Thiohalomonas denitrificans]
MSNSKSLLLLFFGFLVLLVLLGHLFISERNASIRAIEKERHGLTYIDQLRESLEYIQKHRGMALLVGSDDESVPIKLAEIRSIIDETFFALRGVNGPSLKAPLAV